MTRTSQASRPPVAHIMLLLSIPVLAYLAFAVGSKALDLYRLQERSAAIRHEIEALKDRNEALRRQIEYLRSDAAVENVARQQLGLVRAGDTAVILVSSSQGPDNLPPSAPPKEEAPSSRPNWQQWWEIFFH